MAPWRVPLCMPAQTKSRALTNKTFDEAIADHRVVLVDFWATWCGPCKTMAPDLDLIARETEDDVLIAKVDVDKERQLVERFGIQSMPTIITFQPGRSTPHLYRCGPCRWTSGCTGRRTKAKTQGPAAFPVRQLAERSPNRDIRHQ